MRKKSTISTKKFVHAIAEGIEKALGEGVGEAISCKEKLPLNEMARINKHEQGNGVFPFNAYEIQIFSEDHNPPHFHVISNGCNIAFTISDGELYRVISQGDAKTSKYIMANVKHWLSCQCAAQPKLTNQENASLIWDSLHSND